MSGKKLHMLPIIVFVLFPTTFLGTYIAAVLQGHVEPDFPYISDAATYSPESCVFGQFINIGCVLLGLIIYTRYRQINELMLFHNDLISNIGKINKISVWVGLGSCLGLSMVANFQETNVILVHFTGAFACFGLGTVYFWMQAICSYYLYPYAGSIIIAHIRLFLATICTVFFVIVAVAGVMSHIEYKGQNPRKWYPADGGWEYHIASTASEWVVATSFCFYILSFSEDFRSISLDHPPLCIIREEEINIVVIDEDTVDS